MGKRVYILPTFMIFYTFRRVRHRKHIIYVGCEVDVVIGSI